MSFAAALCYASPMKASILVLAGDGIGPEVTAEGTRVLRAVGTKFGHTFTLRDGLLGGVAIDRTGTALPVAAGSCRQDLAGSTPSDLSLAKEPRKRPYAQTRTETR